VRNLGEGEKGNLLSFLSLLLIFPISFQIPSLHSRPSQLSPEHNGSVSDDLRLWLTSSFHPRQSWLDSRDKPIPNAVRTARAPATLPVVPKNTTLPATPPNTLPSQNIPEAANAAQAKLTNESDFEGYNLAAGLEDFKLSLLDYGRSIMISAVNDDSDYQTQQSDIIAANDKVIAQYDAVSQHLKELSHSLHAKDEEASNLRTDVTELERAKAAMEEEKSDVIQAMDVDYAMMKSTAEDHYAEKEKYQKMWEEAEKGRKEAEVELAGIKQDHKRKRERMERMWGNVEREVSSESGEKGRVAVP
jgi:hypothetical protein